MSNIIIGGEQTATAMFGKEGMVEMTPAIYRAVKTSFEEQNMRNPTRDEVKRRMGICLKWAKIMHGDLGWGVQRICGAFADALRSELLGQDYRPSDRQCWMPSDGAPA